MKTPKFAILIGTMSFLVVSPMAVGFPFLVFETNTVQNRRTPALELSRQPIIVSQNDQKTSNRETSPQTDNRNQPIDSEAAVKKENGNAESKASKKPLKPFTPSEKIAAEQAVDFPVDI